MGKGPAGSSLDKPEGWGPLYALFPVIQPVASPHPFGLPAGCASEEGSPQWLGVGLDGLALCRGMKMPKLTTEERRARREARLSNIQFPADLGDIVKTAFATYTGDFTVLESAIGALFLGLIIGWRPLVIIHSPRTIKSYEKILDIKFKEFMPETTSLSKTSRGYMMALKLENFWHGVSGNASVTDRKIAIGLDGQTE